MYRTCLYCTQDLGTNEAIEWLPVGRRIAFDEAKGRLWVVCRKCERWNLVPFDTRLEAIEACERLFRSARLRFSTDNIGIARLDAGLELVRIGSAERREFAAWRYGDQFGRRRRRAVALGVGGVVAVGGVVLGGWALGASLGSFSGLWNIGYQYMLNGVVVARIPEHAGTAGGALTRTDLANAIVRRVDAAQWQLEVKLRPGLRGKVVKLGAPKPVVQTIEGESAQVALAHLLPLLNSNGGSRRVIDDAVHLAGSKTSHDLIVHSKHWIGKPDGATLKVAALSGPVRLAMEMMTHEESERQALAGELKLLERQWRQAESLARIADDLTVSEVSDADLARLRSGES